MTVPNTSNFLVPKCQQEECEKSNSRMPPLCIRIIRDSTSDANSDVADLMTPESLHFSSIHGTVDTTS
jgi:hypothetical protein